MPKRLRLLACLTLQLASSTQQYYCIACSAPPMGDWSSPSVGSVHVDSCGSCAGLVERGTDDSGALPTHTLHLSLPATLPIIATTRKNIAPTASKDHEEGSGTSTSVKWTLLSGLLGELKN